MIQSRVKYGAVIVRTALDRDFSKGIVPERCSLLAVEGETAVAGKLGFIVGLSTLHGDKRYGSAERYTVTFFRRKFGKEPQMMAIDLFIRLVRGLGIVVAKIRKKQIA